MGYFKILKKVAQWCLRNYDGVVPYTGIPTNGAPTMFAMCLSGLVATYPYSYTRIFPSMLYFLFIYCIMLL